MHRVDGQDYAPGHLFREGDPVNGILATQVTADIMNALQEEICAVIQGEDIDLVKADNTQLRQAVVAMIARLTPGNAAMRYVSADAPIVKGPPYLVDSYNGSFTLTLPPLEQLAHGYAIELIDPRETWGAHPVLLARNGNTIEGYADDLSLNVSYQRFTIWWDQVGGNTWRLA